MADHRLTKTVFFSYKILVGLTGRVRDPSRDLGWSRYSELQTARTFMLEINL